MNKMNSRKEQFKSYEKRVGDMYKFVFPENVTILRSRTEWDINKNENKVIIKM